MKVIIYNIIKLTIKVSPLKVSSNIIRYIGVAKGPLIFIPAILYTLSRRIELIYTYRINLRIQMKGEEGKNILIRYKPSAQKSQIIGHQRYPVQIPSSLRRLLKVLAFSISLVKITQKKGLLSTLLYYRRQYILSSGGLITRSSSIVLQSWKAQSVIALASIVSIGL